MKLDYCIANSIPWRSTPKSGRSITPPWLTRSGRPLSRSQTWSTRWYLQLRRWNLIERINKQLILEITPSSPHHFAPWVATSQDFPSALNGQAQAKKPSLDWSKLPPAPTLGWHCCLTSAIDLPATMQSLFWSLQLDKTGTASEPFHWIMRYV